MTQHLVLVISPLIGNARMHACAYLPSRKALKRAIACMAGKWYEITAECTTPLPCCLLQR